MPAVTTTLVIDDICTHDDLIALVGSEGQLNNLIAGDWGGSSEFVRREALEDVLRSLKRRVPPISDTDLSNAPEDLGRAVGYRALASLYLKGVTSKDDHFDVKRKYYAQMADDCLSGLSPQTPSGIAPSGISIRMERG